MYQAELRGKLSAAESKKEDILTSNVFSFFKYADREIFLKDYLKTLGFNVTVEDAKNASFFFWPRYDDNTQPDLVILIGPYYLLIEAKYFSDFGKKTEKSDAQLVREIRGGQLEAKNYGKYFILLAITADHIYKDYKFTNIPEEFLQFIKWTNWQGVASFLLKLLEEEKTITIQEKEFALDLYKLLDLKYLRDYIGTSILYSSLPHLKNLHYIFFQAETAKFRGDFIGFKESLTTVDKIHTIKQRIFFSHQLSGFHSILESGRLTPLEGNIFFQKEVKNESKR